MPVDTLVFIFLLGFLIIALYGSSSLLIYYIEKLDKQLNIGQYYHKKVNK